MIGICEFCNLKFVFDNLISGFIDDVTYVVVCTLLSRKYNSEIGKETGEFKILYRL